MHFKSKPGFKAIFLLVCSLTMMAGNCLAETQNNDCPDVFPDSVIDLKKEYKNWKTHASYPIRLTGAGFMGGPPEMREHLVPTSSKKMGNKRVDTQIFSGTYTNGKWMSCVYGDGTYTLSRELDREVKECSVIYTQRPRDPMVEIKTLCK